MKVIKPIFITTLILPQGYVCQFKVFKAGMKVWEFMNENIELSLLLYYVHNIGFFGLQVSGTGNEVQQQNLICQAIFELEEFYRRH